MRLRGGSGGLEKAAPLLARSLAIKVDEKCLDKMADLQAACLMEGRETLIMSDGHSTSMVRGPHHRAGERSGHGGGNTAQLRYGYYGPYIGSLFDIARIFDSFHTAQYQYIPARLPSRIASSALLLNTAPSFHDPKSVLVLSLPAVDAAQLPPLHRGRSQGGLCVRAQDPLVLPVQGAPLVFSTDFAHGMNLKVLTKSGRTMILPARAEAERGGFVVDTGPLKSLTLADGAAATLQGRWGFDPYQGPVFQLADARDQSWQLAPGDESGLVVGRQDTVHVRAQDAHCVADLTLRDAAGQQTKLEWHSVKPGELEVKIPLQSAAAGEFSLLVSEFGSDHPQSLPLHAYAEAAHLESFNLHAGDSEGVLTGNRLDEVGTLTVNGIEFQPAALKSSDGRDELSMQAQTSLALRQGDTAKGHVALKDGRAFDVRIAIEAPRPSARIIDKTAQALDDRTGVDIRLSGAQELPQHAQITFSLRALTPATFTHQEKVEVETDDGTSALLDASNGGLTFQNARIAVASFDPLRALGASAFGPLKFRIVNDAVAGDWHPLATLVRLPQLKALECPDATDAPCTLSGTNLFLLESVSGDAQFSQAVQIPDGFAGRDIQVPHPATGQIYVRLRDDPGVVSVAVVDPHPGLSGEAVRAQREDAGGG